MRQNILLHVSIVIALLFLATGPLPASELPSDGVVVPLILETYGWLRDESKPDATDVQCFRQVMKWLNTYGTMEGFLDSDLGSVNCGKDAKLCRIDMDCNHRLDIYDGMLLASKIDIGEQRQTAFPQSIMTYTPCDRWENCSTKSVTIEDFDIDPPDGVHDACNAAYTDDANPCVLDPDEYPPDQFVGACAQSQKVCLTEGAEFVHECVPVFNPYDDDPANDPEEESCDDGIDNDCDGIVDNPDLCQCTPGDTTSCGKSDIGGCQLGTATCGPDFAWGKCVGAIDPVKEIRGNNLDDDCNGMVDEDGDHGGGSGGCSLSTTGAAPDPWAVSAALMMMGCLLICRKTNRG